MAFVDPTQPGQDENNQNPSQVDQALNPSAANQAQQQSQSQQAPPSTSAGGAGVASGGAGGAGTGAGSASSPKPSSSGSWTNLDSYLNANSDQATTMGQQIAQSVNDAGNKAQSDIGNLSSGFNSAVTQNTVNENPDAVSRAVGDATSLTGGQNLSADDQQAFRQQANANYSGPTDVTSFNGYNQAQQDVLSASQKANETTSEPGRGTLLNDQYANSSKYGYNQGENNLDQLLLQNSTGAQSAIQPLAEKWNGLNGALNNTVSTGAAQVQNAQTTSQRTAANAKGALDTATKNFQDELNTGLANLQATDSASYNKILSDIQKGGLTPADQQALGIDSTQHSYLSPTSLNTYLNQGAAPTLATYASADQYAQAAALAELAGQSVSPFLAPGTLSQAGTAQSTPAYSFNNTKYSADNQTAQAEYQNNGNNIVNLVNMGFPNSAIDGGFSHFAGPGQINTVDDAVTALNSMIQKSLDIQNQIATVGHANIPESVYAAIQAGAARAKDLLNQINQNQTTYGFAPYSVAGNKVSQNA